MVLLNSQISWLEETDLTKSILQRIFGKKLMGSIFELYHGEVP